MRKYFNQKNPGAYFALRLSFLILISCSSNLLYAQSTDVKIDTVEMTVNIASFSDASPKVPGTRFLHLSDIVQPENEHFDLSKMIVKGYKPKFDGIFITDDNRLIMYGIVIVKAGKNLSVNDPTEHKQVYKQVPNGSGKFKYYTKFTVKGKWVRYQINAFKPNEISQKYLYEKNATHTEGQPYSYYLLHAIESVKIAD